VRNVKCLKTDNGIEYTNAKFRNFYLQHGIKKHFTVHMTPQQNGVAERMNMSIVEKAQYPRLGAGLAIIFWVDAMSM
jgi:transposase InsO family protein